MTDFRTNNNWSEKMSDDLSIEHLGFTLEVIGWLREVGWQRLRSPNPLSFKDWEEVITHVLYLKRDFGSGDQVSRPLKYLYMRTIERGIQDAIAYATQKLEADGYQALWSDYAGGTLRRWCHGYLTFHLDYGGGNLGLGSKTCTPDEARSLIDSMIPLAQILKSNDLLDALASNRHHHDDQAIKLFCQAHKNW